MKVLRFWQAFSDFKHGKGAALAEAQKALFEEVENYRAGRAPRP